MLFNEKLMKRRRELGMTQDELAEKLSVSRQSVSRWENGECMPDSEKLIRLSDTLGVSLDEMTGREAGAGRPALDPPEAARAKRRPLIRVIAAAALCAALGAAGFLLGRYLAPRGDAELLPDAAGEVPAAREPSANVICADNYASELYETTKYSDEGYIVPFDREKAFGETYAHIRSTCAQLDAEAALKLAEQITDRMEQLDKAIREDPEAAAYGRTEDGARIYMIGRVVDGALVYDGSGE